MSMPYYQPSGRVAPVALPLAALLALAIAPGAWAYAWLTIHAPFVLNVFITFGYAFYLGWLVRQAVAEGRVRNLLWAGRAGTVFALLGWYCQWAAWMALTGRASAAPSAIERFLDLLADPVAIGRTAAAILGDGRLDAAGWQVTGVGLLAIWLLELGMHLMLCAPMARMRAEQPFCEAANRWAEKLPVPVEFASVDPATIVKELEADPGQVRHLLERLEGTPAPCFARAELYRCAGSDSYLSLSKVTRTTDAKGKVAEKAEPVFDYLRLPGIDPDDLLRHWRDAPAGAEEALDGNVEADARDLAPELESALAHLQAGRCEDALARAAPHTGSAQRETRADAVRICALACSRLNRWPEACDYWRALDQDEETAHNALQLATSSVMAGALADGVRALEQARERNEESGEMPSIQILTGFVTALTGAGHVREAMPYVDDIRQAYLSAGTTDPTLLFVGGMPPFGVFLEKSLPVVRAALNPHKARRWYASMAARLDEAGQAELSAWMESAFERAAGSSAHS